MKFEKIEILSLSFVTFYTERLMLILSQFDLNVRFFDFFPRFSPLKNSICDFYTFVAYCLLHTVDSTEQVHAIFEKIPVEIY